ncbi:MAG: DUF5615 family PIN-like protein [Solirubrobacteraceae bacterium]
MKLWVDEDLSPSLVDVAYRHGLDATCNCDRALLGRSDIDVRQRCIDEDRTLVTNNDGDFRRLYETSSRAPRPHRPTVQPAASTTTTARHCSGAHRSPSEATGARRAVLMPRPSRRSQGRARGEW